jgi:DNA-binding GntR family transcriptional regulator
MPMPKYETKTEWTANQIRDAILGGRIRPGDRIRIQDWSKRLAVSATPIREALKALEAEGYVRISAHKGAEVTAFSSKEFSDSYRIQLAARQPRH